MQFVVQYITRSDDPNGVSMPSYNPIEAENLALLQQQVKNALTRGEADEAIIYVPEVHIKAERRVEVVSMRPAPTDTKFQRLAAG